MIKYKRILLKLSGEALQGNMQTGIDPVRLMDYVNEIKEVAQMGVEIGIVIGGGNIFRGLSGAQKGFDRVKGDYMGMLATTINGLALQSAFENIYQPVRLFTAFNMQPVGEQYVHDNVYRALQHKEIAILSGGTGNPFFTTDTAAALRAVEIKADVLLKGTRVDGIYTADPEKDLKAVKFEQIGFDEVIDKQLKVMDITAFTLCRENKLPIVVFDMNTPGNLKKLIGGEKIGTIVK